MVDHIFTPVSVPQTPNNSLWLLWCATRQACTKEVREALSLTVLRRISAEGMDTWTKEWGFENAMVPTLEFPTEETVEPNAI